MSVAAISAYGVGGKVFWLGLVVVWVSLLGGWRGVVGLEEVVWGATSPHRARVGLMIISKISKKQYREVMALFRGIKKFLLWGSLIPMDMLVRDYYDGERSYGVVTWLSTILARNLRVAVLGCPKGLVGRHDARRK